MLNFQALFVIVPRCTRLREGLSALHVSAIKGAVSMDIVLMQEDLDRIQACLTRVLEKSGARSTLLIDRSGQLLSSCGDQPPEDSVALAALTAANFGATAAIARMMGERDFSLLFHKGKDESIHFSSFGEDFLLVTIFSNNASLGLVRLHVERAIRELGQIFETVFRR